MSARYDIFLLNSSRQPTAQLDRFKRAEFIKRFNDVGQITIDLDYNSMGDLNLLDWLGGWRILRNGAVWMEGIWDVMADDDADTENARGKAGEQPRR